MECCYYNGGYLAEVANAEEQAKLEAIMLAADGPQGLTAYWLGGNDLHHEGGWIWPSGSPFTFTNWVDGEPNGNDNDNQNCLASTAPRSTSGWTSSATSPCTPASCALPPAKRYRGQEHK